MDNAFAFCSSLTSVVIPASVTSIGYMAFQSCTSLTSITIPDSVASIVNQAFLDCSNLTSVILMPLVPPTLGTNPFDGNAAGRTIAVPPGSVAAYKAAPGWSAYAADIVSQ